MLDPNGSNSSWAIGDNTKNLVEGEREGRLSPSCTDSRENSSSDSDRTRVRMDLNEVITWLRLGRDARANEFWDKYSFPPYVSVTFPRLGP